MVKNAFGLILIVLIVVSCSKNGTPAPPISIPDDKTDTHKVRVKDITLSGLPSPYYHFTYNDSGYITNVDFSTGALLYQLGYTGKRLRQANNNVSVNKDKLQYYYQNGYVSKVQMTHENGLLFKVCDINYDNKGRLLSMKWDRINGPSTLTERKLEFEYYEDDNLWKLKDYTLNDTTGNLELTLTDEFQDYDQSTNVDNFMLWHKSNQHLVLLPGINIQKNIPQKLIHTGKGIHYTATYQYTYNGQLPLTRKGDFTITNGPQNGTKFWTLSSYSYY